MAKRIFSTASFTADPFADGANYTDAKYMAIGASGATAGLQVTQIYWAGQATASAPAILQFARDKILGATLTTLAAPNADGPMDNRTAALAAPALTFVASTTKPQRIDLVTQARLNVGANAFGGVVCWTAEPDGPWGITGITANQSESSLSAYTGSSASAVIGAHLIYEPW
jgi:hypothetical protein